MYFNQKINLLFSKLMFFSWNDKIIVSRLLFTNKFQFLSSKNYNLQPSKEIQFHGIELTFLEGKRKEVNNNVASLFHDLTQKPYFSFYEGNC